MEYLNRKTLFIFIVAFVFLLFLSFFLVQSRTNYGTLSIKSDFTSFEVKINSEKTNELEDIKLKPGKYKIEVSKSDYKTKIYEVQIKKGDDKNLTVELDLVYDDKNFSELND